MTSTPPRRTWKSRLLELLVWAAVSVVTALILIALSERLLPTNF
ncbi:MAG: hypothetical protein ACRDJ0_15885 [Actinomycetota bacterium]